MARPSEARLRIINLLLDFGVNSLTRDSSGDYPIHKYFSRFYRSNNKILTRLLDVSVECENVANKLGNTPMHNACFSGQIGDANTLKLFLGHGCDGCDLFKENNEGQSPFHILLHGFTSGPPPPPPGGDDHFILSILECARKRFLGPSPRSTQTIMIKLLLSCIRRRNWNIARKLLSFIEDLRKEYAPNDPESIHVAANQFCNFGVFDILVHKTRDLSTFDEAGKTPMQLAARRSDLLQVQTIFQKSPQSTNHRSLDRDSMTPVLYSNLSCLAGQQVAQYLVAQGADISIKGCGGVSVIHGACFHGCVNILQTLAIRQLHAAGYGNYKVNQITWLGIGCIHFASFASTTNVMEYLLDEAGFDVDEPSTKDLMTPLHISAFTGNYLMTKFLLGRKAAIDKPNAAGATPLTLAFRSQDPEIVQLIIRAGAIISLDADSIISLEVMTYGKPDQSAVFKNALKSQGKRIQGGKEIPISTSFLVTNQYTVSIFD